MYRIICKADNLVILNLGEVFENTDSGATSMETRRRKPRTYKILWNLDQIGLGNITYEKTM